MESAANVIPVRRANRPTYLPRVEAPSRNAHSGGVRLDRADDASLSPRDLLTDMGRDQTATVGSILVLPGRPSVQWTSVRGYGAIAVAVGGAMIVAAYASLIRMDANMPSVPPLDVYRLLVDSTPVVTTVYAGGEYAPWSTTVHGLRTDVSLWRRMHLANWNTVPTELRAQGLDALLASYRHVFANPRAWDGMAVHDWDNVPQPVRTVAYRQMVAYWTGFYDIGRRYGLAPRLVSDTAAAIVMSESWFDHRAVHRDASGNADIGLAQASDYARARMGDLYRLGVVDVDLATDDYYNPWKATRFAALWFGLLLDEAAGNVDVAVRAYNRGIANAHDDRGSAYLAAVKQRLYRFIRNNDAPPAWAYVWSRGQTIEQEEWPWLSSAG